MIYDSLHGVDAIEFRGNVVTELAESFLMRADNGWSFIIRTSHPFACDGDRLQFCSKLKPSRTHSDRALFHDQNTGQQFEILQDWKNGRKTDSPIQGEDGIELCMTSLCAQQFDAFRLHDYRGTKSVQDIVVNEYSA
jgi:hypothetical protein